MFCWVAFKETEKKGNPVKALMFISSNLKPFRIMLYYSYEENVFWSLFELLKQGNV